jgi:hypothetical protein
MGQETPGYVTVAGVKILPAQDDVLAGNITLRL